MVFQSPICMNYLSFNNFYLFKWICNKSFPSISIFNRKSSFEFDWNQFCGLNCLRRKLLLPIGQTALSRLGWINCEMEIFLISDFMQNVFWRLLQTWNKKDQQIWQSCRFISNVFLPFIRWNLFSDQTTSLIHFTLVRKLPNWFLWLYFG